MLTPRSGSEGRLGTGGRRGAWRALAGAPRAWPGGGPPTAAAAGAGAATAAGGGAVCALCTSACAAGAAPASCATAGCCCTASAGRRLLPPPPLPSSPLASPAPLAALGQAGGSGAGCGLSAGCSRLSPPILGRHSCLRLGAGAAAAGPAGAAARGLPAAVLGPASAGRPGALRGGAGCGALKGWLAPPAARSSGAWNCRDGALGRRSAVSLSPSSAAPACKPSAYIPSFSSVWLLWLAGSVPRPLARSLRCLRCPNGVRSSGWAEGSAEVNTPPPCIPPPKCCPPLLH